MVNYACRVCLLIGENHLNYKLIGKVRDVIDLCLPEIKHTLQNNSIICSQCFYFLKNVSEFRKKCLENQKKLHQNAVIRKISKSDDSFKRKISDSDDNPDHFLELLNGSLNIQNSNTGHGPHLNFQQNILTDNYINNIIISTQRDASSSNIETIVIDSDSEDEKITIEGEEPHVNIKNSNEVTIDEHEVKNIEVDNNEEKTVPIKNIKQEKKLQPKRYSSTVRYDCQFCEKTYKTSNGLFDHCTTKHDDKNLYFCSMCNFFTAEITKIAEHYKVFHLLDKNEENSKSNNPKSFTNCVICNKKILFKSVPRHLEIVHNITDFV
ncbi:unnamed protein product [Brassicogethes aeneus]|uniref:C2H2-type domain-containing protein n=1 Tax=Brassicogethes aeneus TaxID=1431903 RepID=A0A9P0B957_BRAAE|nr:unnamed protein product [Brassicogethes aeneus]